MRINAAFPGASMMSFSGLRMGVLFMIFLSIRFFVSGCFVVTGISLHNNRAARKYFVAWLTMPRRYAGRRMELRHLRYFVAVAEEQNVTRAAARLHVSQPPLSRQIRDLEDELGVALFDHGAKAVRLTEAGRVFLTEARAALQRVDDAVHMAKAVASAAKSTSPMRRR